MAKFTEKKQVHTNVDVSVDVDVDLDISVEDFYENMSSLEENEMIDLLRVEMNIPKLMDTIPDSAKFYKDLAYHVGVSDTSHLEYLIKELQYWSKK